jgi:hypothetical protein
VAGFAGDEIALAATVAPFAHGRAGRRGGGTRRDRALPAPAGPAGPAAALGELKAASIRAHCEAAGMLAARLGLGTGVETAAPARLRAVGRVRHPHGLSGEAIPVGTRLAVLARDVEL